MLNTTQRYMKSSLLLLCTIAFALPYRAEEGARHLQKTYRYLMKQSIPLTSTAGSIHQVISAKLPKAQAYYDQGLAYLIAYDWVKAGRSFYEALRLEPDLAMAHLGAVKAYFGLGEVEQAQYHLRLASNLANSADIENKLTEKEEQWIDLEKRQLDAVLANIEDRIELHEAYKAQVEALIRSYPEDAHALVLRGNAEEPRPAGRGQMGGLESIEWYRAALRRDPKHLGAHHFLIHSYENIGKYGLALEHARYYVDNAPDVAHAHHMHAHALGRMRRWGAAQKELETADLIHRQGHSDLHIPAEYDWHFGHNLRLLAIVKWQLGKAEETEKLLNEAYSIGYNGWRSALFCSAWLDYLLLRNRLRDAVHDAEDCGERWGKVGQVIGAAVVAEAKLELGLIEEAKVAKERVDATLREVRESTRDSPTEWFLSSVLSSFLKPLEVKFALLGPEPKSAYDLAIGYFNSASDLNSFDPWATRIFRLERLVESDKLAELYGLHSTLERKMEAIKSEVRQQK